VNAILGLLPKTYSEGVALSETQLIVPEQRIELAYFPIDALLSVVRILEDGGKVEVGIIGPDGFAPVGEGLSNERWGFGVQVQVPGTIVEVPIADFQAALASDVRVREAVNAFTRRFLDQVMRVSGCRAVHAVPQRLARWLLMAQDSLRGEQSLPMTQTALSEMLGISRQVVNATLRMLRERGAIEVRRSGLYIVDRESLQAACCECYRSAISRAKKP
jgi:CRP-like cAMP-binding protein